MPLIEHAIATYEAAARMLARLLDSRTDLLSSGLSALSFQPGMHLSGGYKDFGKSLGVCLPADSRATMSRFSPADVSTGAGPWLEVLTSDLEWMTFEGWVSGGNARTCFIEADLHADRQVTADVFQRSISSEGSFRDSPPVEWRLPTDGPAIMEVPLEATGEGLRKIVIHLRRPPERIVLRRLALITLP